MKTGEPQEHALCMHVYTLDLKRLDKEKAETLGNVS